MADEIGIVQWFSETNIQAALLAPAFTYVGYLCINSRAKKIYLSDLIQEIETSAFEHWCSPGSDPNNHLRAIRIQSKLKTLGWRINQRNKNISDAFREYREAITGGSFADPNRTFVPFEDSIIELITTKARELRRVLKIKKDH
jgi:hypothetical protein